MVIFRSCRPLFHCVPLIVLFLFSCGKEELKEPTRVDFEFEADPQVGRVAESNGQGGNGNQVHELDVSDGTMYLKEIRVMGKRKEGEDVDFEREEVIEVPLDGSGKGRTYFDLPQGDYEEISLELTIAKDQGPSVMLEGNYTRDMPNQSPQTALLDFSMEKKKIVKLEVEDRNGNEKFELRKGSDHRIRVGIELKKWFRGIGVGRWNNASIQQKPGGKEELPLSKGKNEQLHSKILVRIPKAFKGRGL